jgi:hypothetical protein
MSVSIGLYHKLDLWTANKLYYITMSENRRHLNIKVVIMNVTWNDKDNVSSVRFQVIHKAQFKRI